MKNQRVILAILAVGLTVTAQRATAQRGPQDNWVEEPDLVWGSAGSGDSEFSYALGVATADGKVFVVDNGNARVKVFAEDGEFLYKFGSTGSEPGQLSNPYDIDYHGGLLYLADNGNQRVQTFLLDGTYVTNWPCEVEGDLISPAYIAVDAEHVFIANTDRIYKFSHAGEHVLSWGEPGTVPGSFSGCRGIAVDRKYLYAADQYNYRMQAFTKNGVFAWSWPVPDGYRPWGVDVDDSSIYVTGRYRSSGLYAYRMRLWILDKLGNQRSSFFWLAGTKDWTSAAPFGVAVGNPYVHVTTYQDNRVRTFRRIYRTLGAVTNNAIPLAHVMDVAQREGTYIMDIDYAVSDPDTSNLTVYAAAFANPSNDTPGLAEFVPIHTLVEGTATNIGPGIPAGSVLRLSWDFEADGVTQKIAEYGTVRPAILVRDDREPLDLHMLELPAIGTNAALTINRAPLYDADLMPLWFWTLAAGDSDVSLSTGRVYGVTGDYAGELLADGTNTTSLGREFLFDRLGYREATPAELQYAREATTPGSVAEREPRREPPPTGYRVNEFNFVTVPSSGWWVVPVEP